MNDGQMRLFAGNSASFATFGYAMPSEDEMALLGERFGAAYEAEVARAFAMCGVFEPQPMMALAPGPVPEPAGLSLLAITGLGMLGRRRRRNP